MPSPTPLASLAEFASGLFSSGQVLVSRTTQFSQDEKELQSIFEAAFEEACDELPGDTENSFRCHAPSAKSALMYIYRLCLLLADRSAPEEEIIRLGECMPALPTTADEVLSSDLSLRYLPDIYRMARAISESDPLVSMLERMATSFPLSSVGIPPHLPPDLTLLQQQPCLWGLYLDRILEVQDDSRLANPAVVSGIRDALGMHASLAPRMAAKLTLTRT